MTSQVDAACSDAGIVPDPRRRMNSRTNVPSCFIEVIWRQLVNTERSTVVVSRFGRARPL